MSDLKPTKHETQCVCSCTPRAGIAINLRGYFVHKDLSVAHNHKARTLDREAIVAAALFFLLTGIRKFTG